MTSEELQQIKDRAAKACILAKRIETLDAAIDAINLPSVVGLHIRFDRTLRPLEVSYNGKDFSILANQAEDQDLESELRMAISDVLRRRLDRVRHEFAEV